MSHITDKHRLLAQRTALGLASHLRNGNDDEYRDLFELYVRDAFEMGIPQGMAYSLLAQRALRLLSLADDEWLYETALGLVAE
jgi:hypothetical protein